MEGFGRIQQAVIPAGIADSQTRDPSWKGLDRPVWRVMLGSEVAREAWVGMATYHWYAVQWFSIIALLKGISYGTTLFCCMF